MLRCVLLVMLHPFPLAPSPPPVPLITLRDRDVGGDAGGDGRTAAAERAARFGDDSRGGYCGGVGSARGIRMYK